MTATAGYGRAESQNLQRNMLSSLFLRLSSFLRTSSFLRSSSFYRSSSFLEFIFIFEVVFFFVVVSIFEVVFLAPLLVKNRRRKAFIVFWQNSTSFFGAAALSVMKIADFGG